MKIALRIVSIILILSGFYSIWIFILSFSGHPPFKILGGWVYPISLLLPFFVFKLAVKLWFKSSKVQVK